MSTKRSIVIGLIVIIFLCSFTITCNLFGWGDGDDDSEADDDVVDDDSGDDDIVDDDDDTPQGMALIPAGPYIMGCNEYVDSECNQDEYPQHEVYISAFYMDIYETTNQQFADYLNEFNHENICDEVLNYFPCIDPADEDRSGIRNVEGTWVVDSGWENKPAVGVSWEGARDFCNAYGLRLPTEAEWEKAARLAKDELGNKFSFLYPWGDFWEPNRANWAHNNDPYETGVYPRTTPVGFFDGSSQDGYQTADGRSPFGLHDMAGNVSEWVSDWYGPGYYQSSPYEDPQGPVYPLQGMEIHVQRGGIFASLDYDLRASNRFGGGDTSSSGVRCTIDFE